MEGRWDARSTIDSDRDIGYRKEKRVDFNILRQKTIPGGAVTSLGLDIHKGFVRLYVLFISPPQFSVPGPGPGPLPAPPRTILW